MNIYLFLEDWDNSELDEYEWMELMKEKVLEYNQEYGTNYKPEVYVRNYLGWKRDKAMGDT